MPFTVQRHRILGGITRSRLLQILRQSARPMGVRELGETLGLHANTIREHLDQLIDAGLVDSTTERPAGRGRPRLSYVLRANADEPNPEAYRALAGVLAEQLAGVPDARAAAVSAGERWGHSLVEDPPARIDEREAIGRLVGLLGDVGFEPDQSVEPGEPIRLHNCPFGSLAVERSEVVCGVHLGLMRGVLGRLGASFRAVALEPFVTPDLCLAHLGVRVDD
ncbi:MAG: helix-turn-helix domain-containing protein [Chloroflexota bacterium]